jgi:ATP-dependent exoDNAse (exonuclease V) alpha subunit
MFGDVMQLPPVVADGDVHARAYFQSEYDGKVMFFNSHYFKHLRFKTQFLRKSFRQADQEFSDKLYEIGFRDHTQETLDYFNSRVMSLPKFETSGTQYVFMAPTNAVIDKRNSEYMATLNGKAQIYRATKSKNCPVMNGFVNEIVIKVGAQAMCTANRYSLTDPQHVYSNGMIGEVVDLDANSVTLMLPNGKTKIVQKSTSYIYESQVVGNRIRYAPKHQYTQIDCRICRAITIHKSQGKSFERAYFAPANWIPPSITYVALSRLRTLDGLGLARELQQRDIVVNEESYEFLTR